MAFSRHNLFSEIETLAIVTKDSAAEVMAPGYMKAAIAGNAKGGNHGLRAIDPNSRTIPQLLLVVTGDEAPFLAYIKEIRRDGDFILDRVVVGDDLPPFLADPTGPMTRQRRKPTAKQEMN